MGGNLGWVLGIAILWGGAPGAWAQTPADRPGTDIPKVDLPNYLPSGGMAPADRMTSANACSTDACNATPSVPMEYRPDPPTFFFSADYLLWWIHRGPLPEQPLVTTGPQNSQNAGIVGQPGTQTLFGGPNGLDWHGFSGARITAGFNLISDGSWAFEAAGFYLPRQSINFSAASTSPGVPLITRPIYDNINKVESTYDVSSSVPVPNAAVPGLIPRVSGTLDIQATTEFWGYELNFRHHPITNDGSHVDLLFGFRSLGLDENLQFHSDSTPNPANPGILSFGGVPVNDSGDHVTTMDFFGTQNRFYGPQVGGGFNWQWGRLNASLAAKIAAGINHQSVTINGESTASGSVNGTLPGGIYALPTNIGNYSRDVFCLVPEFDLGLTYDITPWLRARLGYNLLYWSSVVRPGSQIDRNIDVTQVPTDQAYNAPGSSPATRPNFSFRDTDFWAQGLNFGLEIRY